jgi:rSAM/selenodomain-associated transferase 2/rSAM/selenodomain-associated transferase 1
MSAAPRRLILFGRYPRPGVVKTRLIPALGPLGAADLHRRLCERTLKTMLRAAVAPLTFCFTGASRARMVRWLGDRSLDLQPQAGGDPGRRMQNSLEAALCSGARHVVLVGSDIPGLAEKHLHDAFAALQNHDVVLGPSRDGGYWLVGLRRPADIFSDIPWGGPEVLFRTLAAARHQGLSVGLVETLNDIDRPEDLASLPPADRKTPYLSIVIPTLNEAARIQETIAQIGPPSPDIEIILADGGSTDDTVVRAKAAGANVLLTAWGRAVQQNAGAAIAKGKVLLFLHADTRLPESFGAQLFDALLDRRTAWGAFGFKTDYDHWGMRVIECTVQVRSRLLKMPYADQALFMPRAVFQQAGGFPSVPIAEDLFLARRLRSIGRLALAPGCAVTSGRRWQALGIWRTTLINLLVAVGCLAGISPANLAPLYRIPPKRK